MDIEEHIADVRKCLNTTNEKVLAVDPNESQYEVFDVQSSNSLTADRVTPVASVSENNALTYTPLLPLKSASSIDTCTPGNSSNLSLTKSTSYQFASNLMGPSYEEAFRSSYYGDQQYADQRRYCMPTTPTAWETTLPEMPPPGFNCRSTEIQEKLMPATAGNENVLPRDDEIRLIKSKMEELATNMPTKADFKIINSKLGKLLRKRINIMPPIPPSFPLKSVEQITAFDNVSEDEYEVAVNYLQFLGGRNVHEAVTFCLKEAISDEAIRHYSAWGDRGNLPLYGTKLIKAIYDAVALNFQPPPNKDTFFREIAEGVRFGKQRLRNLVRGRRDLGRRERIREEAEHNLFGQQCNEDDGNIQNDSVDEDNDVEDDMEDD